MITGDVHASYVCDVKADFDDPASATVATELVGTSISSGGDGVDQRGAPIRDRANFRISDGQPGARRS